ncbi:putative ATPase [Mycolicibacterium chubuense NBB4]|uniref:Putative ATPase n=1 Tax=Mycolicibacterium chubuense (strain NBB4) TaxID=710421 RepID=I4BLV1_MYCCN|nr:BTAD domain-containing putative transcriptional regulator [Mycolicibacterium chubuense]AFM18258.1 putative ATPase [Mycolicibacterium chubuense NBB4]
MATAFRILGEIEALVDGQPLDVGHARQRCVLACLLVDVNRPVPAHELIERIWADAPPYKARNALAAYISRLRHLLGAAGAARIVRGPNGYALDTDPRSVDLCEFRDLVSRARCAANADTATGLFDEALGLWRATPLATLATPWADEVRRSLETDRMRALLDRNDAALAAGRHAELLGDLAMMLRSQPLDERVAGQLMLAQFRSGRQADALDTYRTMRGRLVDELGVDPSPALQSVYHQILDGDPARPAPSPHPHAGIPKRATRLIGRQQDIAHVSAALAEGPVVTLTGVGGVGKTRLAFETADRALADRAGGAWVCEFSPLGDGAAVGQAVAHALAVQRSRGQEFDDAVLDYLRPLGLLLVLDNCEHVLADAARLVERIARECPHVTVLATSREPLGVEGERVLPVQPLSEDHAAELFTERARASRPDFDPEREPVGAVAEICRRLDGVPLAIELAAARMRAMSSLDVARRLDRLRLLSGGSRGAHPRQQSVTATIDWSYRLLSPAEQQLFARLSVFAGGFDLEAVREVCVDEATGEDDVLDLVTGLVDKSMVTVRSGAGATRYSVLHTLRSYGRQRLEEDGSAEDVAARHARHYVELIERAAAGMRGPDEAAWVERITPRAGTTYAAPDFDNLRSAYEFAMARHDMDLVLRLVTSLPDVHLRIGYHSIDWVERAVTTADPDHPLYPAAVGTIARAAWVLGEFSHACELAGLAGGRAPRAGASYIAHPSDVVADAALYEGDARSALTYYRRLLANPHDVADPLRLALIVDRITFCHRRLGTSEDDLIRLVEDAVGAADDTANPSARSLARCSLGRAVAEADPDRAMRVLREAAELATSVENNWLIGMARMEMAVIRATRGDLADAARSFVDVLDHWERGGPGIIAQQWDTLGHVVALLRRSGDAGSAAALRRVMTTRGRQALLQSAEMDEITDAGRVELSDAEVVDFARTALRQYSGSD